MTKLTLAVAALTAVLALAVGRAEAQPLSPIYPLPKAAQPSATTTTTMAPPAPTPAPPPQIIASGTTTPIQAVSLRASPDTSASIIGTLQPGMQLRVLATANYGWTQVESPVGSGWAYGSYLAPGGAPPPQKTSP
jgi:uncharacterized protein YraI